MKTHQLSAPFSVLHLTAIRLMLLVCIVVTFNSCEKKVEEVPVPLVYGSVGGIVQNYFDQPIDAATVTITGDGVKRSVNTANGLYEFKNIKVGRYELAVSQPNFIGASTIVQVTDEQKVEENFRLKSGQEYLIINDTVINALPSSYFQALLIQSNASWTVHTEADWLTLSKTTGSGNGQLTIEWQENSSLDNRTALVRVSAGNVKKYIKVKQDAQLKVVASALIHGNGAKSVTDSVYVRFNKKVKLKKLKPHLQTCISPINTTYTDDNHGFKFNYGCAQLGGEYSFDLDIEDEYGLMRTFVIKLSLYHRKLEVAGRIVQHLVDEANKTYWIITNSPHIIYEIGMSDLEVKRKFDVSFQPLGMAINYLTNELYVYQDAPVISVLSRTTGLVKRRITIPASPEDHPSHPTVYPYNLKFTKNGLGILLLNARGSSAVSWRMIDSQQQDAIYDHDQLGFSGDDYHAAFYGIQVNHTQNKLLLTTPFRPNQVTIFDQDSRKFTRYTPSSGGSSNIYVVPNRKDDRVFVGQYHHQSIFNSATGLPGSQLQLISGSDANADFSYKAPQANVMYLNSNQRLQVVDLDNAVTDVWHRVISGLKGISATTDGKYLLFYNTQDWNTIGKSAYVLQLSTDILH